MPKESVAKKRPEVAKLAKPQGAKRGARAKAPPPGRRVEPEIVLYDLLDEPLLGVETGDGHGGASLPEVLAGLGAGGVRAFTALQAHQQHAWHAFLVQLAAVALKRAGKSEPKQSAATWRKLLLDLTDGRREPWCLVVSDLGRPAFLQPPVPERALDSFKAPIRRPDEIDVLVTSKNHDVKAARIRRARPEHWVFALVSLQTMEGFSGRCNYGVARMNGGFASRAVIGFAPGLRPAERWRRDTRVLLDAHEKIAADRYDPKGEALLWLSPWDGKRSLRVEGLDPFFIEVCRRVRLVGANDIAARYKPTEAARVRAAELKGNTGDPWTATSKAEAAAFTATEHGFDYRTLQRLLSDDFERGAAFQLSRAETKPVLVATVLARGQGETNGFHHRTLPIPERAAVLLRSRDEALARLARERVEVVGKVKLSVLKPALLTLLQGAPDRLDFKDKAADRWLDHLDAAVDREFFERLWADLEGDPDACRAGWERWLRDLARAELHGAIEGAPIPSARRYRCIAAAERVLEGAARKHLPNAYPMEVTRGLQS